MREIEKQLLESYGFNIKFHIKEMDEAYTDEELYNDQINFGDSRMRDIETLKREKRNRF